MPTLEQLINSLKNDRATVVTNLNTKGVEASSEETFTELAPKILDIPTGDSSIRKVATVTEMNAIQNPNKGDICLVYNNTLAPLSDRTPFNSFYFPTEVQLDHAIDSFKAATFSQNYDMMSSPCQFSMNTNYISFRLCDEWSTYGENVISYVPDPNMPNKWILNATGTKGSFISGTKVTFPEGKTMTWDGEGTNYPSGADMSDMFNFILIGEFSFTGLYTYDGTQWTYLDINIPLLSTFLTKNQKAYTNDGVITGTMYDVHDDMLDEDWCNYTEKFILYINSLTSWKTRRAGASSYGIFKGLNSKYIPILNYISCRNLTDLSFAFSDCSNLLIIPQMDITVDSNATIALTNFAFNCTHLQKMDLSNLTITKCSDLNNLCYGCSDLTEFKAPTINSPSDIVISRSVFVNCTSLQTLDLSTFTFDIKDYVDQYSTVNTGQAMFNGCTALQNLDIRNLNILQVGRGMFDGVPNNCNIIVKTQAMKDLILAKYPSLTNITVA